MRSLRSPVLRRIAASETRRFRSPGLQRKCASLRGEEQRLFLISGRWSRRAGRPRAETRKSPRSSPDCSARRLPSRARATGTKADLRGVPRQIDCSTVMRWDANTPSGTMSMRCCDQSVTPPGPKRKGRRARGRRGTWMYRAEPHGCVLRVPSPGEPDARGFRRPMRSAVVALAPIAPPSAAAGGPYTAAPRLRRDAAAVAKDQRSRETPGIQSVPASGTPAIAAASTVSATRSSRSR
jgi:hypothetical protein